MGSKNPQWRGDNVGYGKLHSWVRSRFPKPEKCNHCKKVEPVDLANKGIYNRELKNWEWLCRRCHMVSDGRLKQFLSTQKKFEKGNQYYKLREDKKGSESPVSKLNEENVLEIREKYKSGNFTQKQIADEYNVCFQLISLIVNRQIWKHI